MDGRSGASASIFVSIASYRDSQCQYTVQDLFLKAAHPDRVVVGICFQVAPEDEDNFLLDLDPWGDRIRTYFLRHVEAKGPCYARALIQQHLFKSEDYYFQIDSHFRFAPGWDETCLEQLRRCPSPKPILTAYASSYTLPKDYVPGEPDRAVLAVGAGVTVLCADTFGDLHKDDPFMRIKTRSCRSDFGHVPPPALFWTARFAFSAGSVVDEVPYDPHLDYVFFGEEISMSARLWTSGWDMFNPTKVIAYHLGSRAHRHWFREVQATQHEVEKETAAKHRICGLLGTPWPEGFLHTPPPAPYGLGFVRTLREYETFAGVDFAKKVIHERGRNGGVSPELLPPLWAEEERERVMQETQLRDTASWAGKGAADEVRRQLSGRPGEPAPTSRPELAQARHVALLQVEALRAELSQAGGPEVHLELSRAFCALGRVEAVGGGEAQAAQAYAQALEHARAAGARQTDQALWRAGVLHAEAAALVGMRRHEEAKGPLLDSLRLASSALAEARDEASERLAGDVLEAVHLAHERSDDRRGLERFARELPGLLRGLRRVVGEEPLEAVPALTSVDARPSLDAPGGVGPCARLLERAVLICIATGRPEEIEVVREIFMSFSIARESPPLLRLLGLLQSSGHLLDA